MKLAQWQQDKKRVAAARDKLQNDAVVREMFAVVDEEHPRWKVLPAYSHSGVVISADDRSYQLGVLNGVDYVLKLFREMCVPPPKPPKETEATYKPEPE